MTADRRDQLADHARQLASAGFSFATAKDFDGCVQHIVRELDRMIRQAQAEAYTEAANDVDDGEFSNYASRNLRAWFLHRAAVLRLTTDHPDVTQDAP